MSPATIACLAFAGVVGLAIGFFVGALMAGRHEDAVYERGMEAGAELAERRCRERAAERRRQVAERRRTP